MLERFSSSVLYYVQVLGLKSFSAALWRENKYLTGRVYFQEQPVTSSCVFFFQMHFPFVAAPFAAGKAVGTVEVLLVGESCPSECFGWCVRRSSEKS